jgi:hypothetical protein
MTVMEVKVECCCGLDVHQKTVVAYILTGPLSTLKPGKEIKTFGTRTHELRLLGNWLKEANVQKVLMESTGQYWCPVWNILEEFQLDLAVANPQRIKGIPGKKLTKKMLNGLLNYVGWDL